MCFSEASLPDSGLPGVIVEGRVGERGKQYCTEVRLVSWKFLKPPQIPPSMAHERGNTHEAH